MHAAAKHTLAVTAVELEAGMAGRKNPRARAVNGIVDLRKQKGKKTKKIEQAILPELMHVVLVGRKWAVCM